jgi:predicted nucleotidyltransferase component of viral defense system
MILQKEIREFASKWNIPPDTVDKDYVLGHFLATIFSYYGDELVFKGGTCLRKCYFPNYRFSEDLDFTAKNSEFILEDKDLNRVCQRIQDHSGILLYAEKIEELKFQDKKMGYQVKIKYWGANHSKNQQPPAPDRWITKIKLEISTAEICLLSVNNPAIYHPYSDYLSDFQSTACYQLNEIIAEKLRSLVQRSYTAPRDYYDLYHLTTDLDDNIWQKIRELFLQKMEHKNIEYRGPEQLVKEKHITTVKKAWQSSIAHQIDPDTLPSADEIIDEVRNRILYNL